LNDNPEATTITYATSFDLCRFTQPIDRPAKLADYIISPSNLFASCRHAGSVVLGADMRISARSAQAGLFSPQIELKLLRNLAMPTVGAGFLPQ
jgi:hypothetical protein